MRETGAEQGAAGRPQTPFACACLAAPVAIAVPLPPESRHMTPTFAPLSPP